LREQTVSCEKTSQRPGAESAGAFFIARADKPTCHSSTTNHETEDIRVVNRSYWRRRRKLNCHLTSDFRPLVHILLHPILMMIKKNKLFLNLLLLNRYLHKRGQYCL